MQFANFTTSLVAGELFLEDLRNEKARIEMKFLRVVAEICDEGMAFRRVPDG
jgi:hypothetical protein